MAAYSKNKNKTQKKKDPTILKEINYLNTLLRYSLKSADNTSEELNKLFMDQADKLKAQIEKLQNKQ